MKWCLFDGGGRATASAIKTGLDAIGEDSFFLDGDVWHDSYWSPCDVGVVFGMRDAQKATIASCEKRGVPTVVIDLGYTRRFSHDNVSPWATLQVSVGRTSNILPPFPCQPDRRTLYGIEYPSDRSAAAGYVLVCGQWPTDPTHPFRSEDAIRCWIDSEVKPRAAGREVRYRSHPRLRHPGTALEMDFAGASVVVTWSSNSAIDALLFGIPVVCWDRDAVCAPLALYGPDLASLSSAAFPDQSCWEAFFNRLAYGQWSFDELRTGVPQMFVMDWISGNVPVADEPVAPDVAAVPQEPEPEAAVTMPPPPPMKRPRGRPRKYPIATNV